MSLDQFGLQIVRNSGSVDEKRYANALLPLRKQGNFLLCTLLLGNTLVNALLAIFLAELTGGVVGSIVTTFSIVILGEIIPQSVCSRYGLYVGYQTRFIVIFFMVVCSVIAGPIAWVLDRVMGPDSVGQTYNRAQLKELISLTSNTQHGELVNDEVDIVKGAIDFSVKTVEALLLKKRGAMFTLDVNERLDTDTMTRIVKSGYSRVPVVDGGEFLTILLIKNLILLDPNQGTPIRNLLGQSCCVDCYYVKPNLTLDKMLNEFQVGRTHMAIVQRVKDVGAGRSGRFENIGLITLEDVLEELIGEEIADETDNMKSSEFVQEFRRMQTMNQEFGDDEHYAHLSEKEVEQVATMLRRLDSDDAKRIFAHLTERQIKHLVRLSKPCVFDKNDDGSPQVLWESGTAIDYCYLVLSDGPLEVQVTGEEFIVEVGPWGEPLGLNCLDQDNYVTEFVVTAKQAVRLLKISRRVYQTHILGAADDDIKEEEAAFSRSKSNALFRAQSTANSRVTYRRATTKTPGSPGGIKITIPSRLREEPPELPLLQPASGKGRQRTISNAREDAGNASKAAMIRMAANPKRLQAAQKVAEANNLYSASSPSNDGN
jgi:metal transporter CNNM